MDTKFTEQDFEMFRDVLLENCKEELLKNNLVEAFRKICYAIDEGEGKKLGIKFSAGSLNLVTTEFAYLFVNDYLNIDLSKNIKLGIELVKAIYGPKGGGPDPSKGTIFTTSDFHDFIIDNKLLSEYKTIGVAPEGTQEVTLTFAEGVNSLDTVSLGFFSKLILNLPSSLKGHLDLYQLIPSLTVWNVRESELILNIKAVTNKDGKKESSFEFSREQLNILKSAMDIQFNFR